jgi:hypothetical protein
MELRQKEEKYSEKKKTKNKKLARRGGAGL